MKRFLIILLLLSIQVGAQEKASSRPHIFEAGFNHGTGSDNSGKTEEQYWGRNRYGKITLAANIGVYQPGIFIDGGTLSNGYKYISPSAFINLKLQCHKAYFYFGCSAGYLYTWNRYPFQTVKNKVVSGYILGLHTGYVQPFAEHWAFTGDLSWRYATVYWAEYFYSNFEQYYFVPAHHEYYSMLPLSLGIRYNF